MMKRRRGFTLIEMLVVIAVIGIIMGMVFKMFSLAVRSSNAAKTRQILEQIAHAINEYSAEYGTYPPTSGVVMSVEDPGLTEGASVPYFANVPPTRRYGLAAYLLKCPPYPDDEDTTFAKGKQWLKDAPRDTAFKNRIEPFVSGLKYPWTDLTTEGGFELWTMNVTFLDAWTHRLQYECKPPYTSFKLWSIGNNGIDEDGGGDDIVAGKSN